MFLQEETEILRVERVGGNKVRQPQEEKNVVQIKSARRLS
jgi:hypothetical protein